MPSYYQVPVVYARESIVDSFERTAAIDIEPIRQEAAQRAMHNIHGTVYFSSYYHFRQLEQDLAEVALLPPDWNSYDAPAPTQQAVETLRSILESLENADILPRKVLPSADGGVALIFMPPNANRAMIESLNDEGVSLLFYDRQGNARTSPWSTNPAERLSLLNSLRRHLEGEPLATQG